MRLLKVLKSTTLVLAIATAIGTRADDTDIYTRKNATAAGEPFLMLVLDWRPDVIGSNACTFHESFSTDNNGCDKRFNYGPIGELIRRVNKPLNPDPNQVEASRLTRYVDGQSISPADAFRAVIAAFLLGYKVVKRDSSGTPITIDGTQCPISGGPDACYNSYPGAGKPNTTALNDANGINIGLMLSHANKGNNSACPASGSGNSSSGKWSEGCSNGAYVLKGFATIEDTDTGSDINQPLFQTLKKLYALPEPAGGNDAHTYQGKEIYAELYRYLTAGAPLNADRGYQDFGTTGTDLGGDCTKSTNGKGDGTTNLNASCEGGNSAQPYSWDTSIVSSGLYVNPLGSSNACSKMYAVNTLSGQTNQDDDSDAAIQRDMGLGASGRQITFPDVIGYMYQQRYRTTANAQTQYGLTSYFLSQSTSQTVNSWAAAGGTAAAIPYAGDLNQLLIALQDVARQILSVSTTFVAASVPVSAFNRVLTDENYYIALFRSDPNGNLYWPGNLKRLKVQVDTLNDGTKQLRIVARNPSGSGVIDAFDPNDGRLNWNALTYWTNQSALPAITDPMYQSVPENVANMVTGADGRVVERGGAGQKIPGAISGYSPGEANGSGTRQLYTEPLSGTTALNGMIEVDAQSTSALKANGQLQALLGLTAGDSTRTLKLLRYIRGLETTTPPGGERARKWIMGSAIHSRPVPINYGLRSTGDTSPDIRLFLGTNDGWFHQFKNSTGSGTDLGTEVFAFMPHEAMGVQKYLVASDPFAVRDADFTQLPAETVMYGVDGPMTAYLEYGADNVISTSAPEDKAYVYFGMRRGGYGYYAFDVKNPDSPQLVWTAKKSNSDFAELGMTFSQPVVAHVKYENADSTDVRVLIFGGGYNGGWSGTSRVGKDAGAGTDNQGNAIYIVNAETGQLIWKAVQSGTASSTRFVHSGLVHSIPSDLAVIDINGDGYQDAAFVGDTGGNLWRVDFPSDLSGTGSGNNRANNWRLTKVATLATSSGASADQRFFSAPEVVRSRDMNCNPLTDADQCNYIAIALGSGNREDPLDTLNPVSPPQNWFYLVKDRNVFTRPTTDATTVHSQLYDATSGCFTAGSCTTSDLAKGWRVRLTSTGEKAVTDPVIRLGTLFFTTYVPPVSTNSCAPAEGGSYVYAVSLINGDPMKNYDLTNQALNVLDRRRAVGPGIVPPPPPLIPPGLIGDIFMFPGDAPEDVIQIPPLPVYWYESNVDK